MILQNRSAIRMSLSLKLTLLIFALGVLPVAVSAVAEDGEQSGNSKAPAQREPRTKGTGVEGSTSSGSKESTGTTDNSGAMFRHGPAKDELAAFLVCQPQKFKLGEAIPLFYGVVVLDHTNAKTVKIWPPRLPTGENNESWFSIIGPGGKKFPSVAPGVEWPAPKTAVTLHRGELHGKFFSDLLGWHRIREPGTYTIVWHYHAHGGGGPWRGRLVSNKVQFEVVR